MSGGSYYDYAFSKIEDLAADLRRTTPLRKAFARHLVKTANACSKLYAAAWKAARALGYRRCITYILDTERGASVTAAGWRCVGKAGGGSWSCKSRPRVDKHPTQGKLRFEIGA